MVNLWFPSSNASAARPPLLTAGESQNPIPPLPPDPPDPDFPPLDNSPPLSHRELQTARLSKAVVSISHPPSTAGVDPFLPASPMFNLPAKQLPAVSFGSIGKANLENLETLKVIPPKPFSPVQTNRASNGSVPVPFILPPPSVNQNPILQKPSPAKLCAPSTSTLKILPPWSLPPLCQTKTMLMKLSNSPPPCPPKNSNQHSKSLQHTLPTTISLSKTLTPPFDSSPNSDPKPSLKRTRSNPSLEVFPSFTAQLSFFTSTEPKTSSRSEPHSPSSVHTFNPFAPLDPPGLLPPEEGKNLTQ
ncbi:hypothetical protein F2Q69_00019606 [Brassica cretica]|uniref:Uncharacterized protein n=1 Tax=Brassica cretica TaxID=69181 RepID=A0A8S9Q090_BRACR|nr:hypothetical protein F2Q69_00019606 [Brassica cretica]